MKKYSKAIAGAIPALAAIVFKLWGEDLGLPPDWPEMVAAALVPVFVAGSPKNAG